MEAYSPKETRKAVGITNRQLDHWITSGLLKPEIETAGGHGNSRLFTFRDLVGLKTIARLRSAGVSLQDLRKVQANVVKYSKQNKINDVFKDTFLIVQGNEIFMAEGDGVLDVLQEPGQYIFPAIVLDMAGTIEELRQEVGKLRKAG